MFLGPYEEGGDFRDQSISGVRRFLDRLWASVARRDDATARADADGDAQAAPDDQEGRRRHPAAELQHRDRGDDGVHELAAARRAHAASRRGASRSCSSSRRSRRTSPRSCGSSSATTRERVRCRLAGVRRGAGRRGDDRRSPCRSAARRAERFSCRRARRRTRRSQAAMADPTIAKFVTGPPKKVIFVPGRLLNIVV